MKTMTIGQLAKETGVGVETIRFYERRGLIEEPSRRESGYREYSDDVPARVDFIKRAKELGFSLKEISELLSLRMDPETTCGDLKNRADQKISDVEDRIQALQKIRKALKRLASTCTGVGPQSECPIVAALEGHKEL